MTIAELAQAGKSLFDRIPRAALGLAILVLSCSASFGLGILAGKGTGSDGVSINELGTTTPDFLNSEPAIPSSAPTVLSAGGEVVASKNGTKYYLPWCGSVKLIKDENKVWFASRADAEAQGYEPASNCKGL